MGAKKFDVKKYFLSKTFQVEKIEVEKFFHSKVFYVNKNKHKFVQKVAKEIIFLILPSSASTQLNFNFNSIEAEIVLFSTFKGHPPDHQTTRPEK